EVLSGRFGGLKLQGQVHALVASVLLRATWLDAFDLDAEPEPPHGELGKIKQRIGRSEGHTVVGSDGFGQAELFEDAFESREGKPFLGGGSRSESKEMAAGEIRAGKRIEIPPICEHELALIVGAPQLVGLEGFGKGRALAQLAPAQLAALDQPM